MQSESDFSSQSSLASSINHWRKRVSAIASSVAFSRFSKSILSSKELRIEAIRFCSSRGGSIIVLSRNPFKGTFCIVVPVAIFSK